MITIVLLCSVINIVWQFYWYNFPFQNIPL